MNRRLVIHTLSMIMIIEAIAMIPSLIIALCYGEGDAIAFAVTVGIMLVIGLPVWFLIKPDNSNLRAREGFFIVSLSWILLSFFGALPFVFSGMISHPVDALFESISGFTTTGATILREIESNPHGLLFWRSFTHWIGGMGVLVLSLALLPRLTGRTAHLVRAESPGPTLSKLAPKMGDTAKILYLVYLSLTLAEFVCLMLAGMNPFDAAIHALGTAGTGGFSNYNAGIAAFDNLAVEIIMTLFMILFGINMALVFKTFSGDRKALLKSEETRWYLGIVASVIILETVAIMPIYKRFDTSLRYASFQVASIISTSGFSTADFNQWGQFAKMLLVMVMCLGGCAGSTAGGMKTIRFAMVVKQGKREIRRTFQPRKVQTIRFEGKGVEETLLQQASCFFFMYFALVGIGAILLSTQNIFDFETNFTAALTCVSNVGPGIGAVGPTGNFADYNAFSKIVLCILMLAGRLELFPVLALFHPTIWSKK